MLSYLFYVRTLISPSSLKVVGSGDAAPAAPAPVMGTIRKSSKGPVPCRVKMLDGSTMQLFAEPNTTGQNFLDQSEYAMSFH